jgi:hypothetical protein
MKMNTYLSSRLRELFLDGRWIANTNYQDQLKEVTWQQALQQVQDLNSIALLTYHVNYYLQGLLQVLRGGDLEIRDRFSFDMPPIESEEDWQQLVQTLLTNAEAFAAAVEQMEDTQFAEPFVKEEYGNYLRNIEGVIEHSYYHLGQISLIRKLVLNR